MKWRKLGRIWNTEPGDSWLQSHASVPVVAKVGEDLYRILFSGRDKQNRSHTASIYFNMATRSVVSEPEDEPVLKPGTIGLFDDCGVTLSCFLPDEGFYYYLGWNATKTVDYNNEIGLAYGNAESKSLVKHSRRPVFGKCEEEPFTFGYPWVLKVGEEYFMWYDVLLDWGSFKFELRSAKSSDGVNWIKTGVASPELKPGESGIARPCVLHEDGIFKMWYSVKLESGYVLGYGESQDGIHWERMDSQVGITTSEEGWDSEQVEHPVVFDHDGNRYMLYNGNGFGASGIGLAVLESE